MSSELGSGNPRKWRFSWEAQSHIPTLRLFLFDQGTKPSRQCKNLEVHLNFERSLLLVSWFEDETKITFRVPVPRVLVDIESPIGFRAMEDHIEVKLVLLLPVDHHIVSNIDSILNMSEYSSQLFSMDSGKPRSLLFIVYSVSGIIFKLDEISLQNSLKKVVVEQP